MDSMDAMENDNLNVLNKLSDFISDDENEELRCLGSMRSDANFNGLHEEYSAAAGFHHSQFPDPSVSFSHPNFAGSFSDSISYTDIDWSFDDSRWGLSSQNWSHSILTNSNTKTNASFHVRSPDVPSICGGPMRSQAAESLHIIGCERETNNHNLQSSGCGEKIDLNIAAICSGLQPHCFEELDVETLNKTDKISGFKDNTGDIPNLTTFSENAVGVRRSNFINFSLHPSSAFQPSIIAGEENPFPTPSNEDALNPAVEQSNEDILNSLKIAAPPTTASSNSQIGLSSQSWFTDLESCLLRRDQSQHLSEQQSHTDVRNFSSEFSTFAASPGISATISVPDHSFELDQSSGPSQPPQNVGDALTPGNQDAKELGTVEDSEQVSGNQDAKELGTVEDSGLAKSYPKRVTPVSNPTCSNSSPSLPNPPLFDSSTVSANTDMLFQAHIAHVLSASASPDISSHVPIPIQPQTTQIDPDLQKEGQIFQSIITESAPLVSSKFEDLRLRSLRRSRTSRCYIKCRDLDETPELSGQRCYLCKRDLSFKPEGSLVLPKILPTVAVLPCSHVFHDLCLERITPQDQAEDPPCIPCAVGEI